MESEAVCEGLRRSSARTPTRATSSPMTGSKITAVTPIPMSPEPSHIQDLLQEAKKDLMNSKRKLQDKPSPT